jgi:nitrogen-specific signal transduction histidine kinase
MCIKVEQDERQRAQMLPRQHADGAPASRSVALAIDISLAALQAGAALMWLASGEEPIARGRRELTARLRARSCDRRALAARSEDDRPPRLRANAGDDACPAIAAVAARLGLRSLVVLDLCDGPTPWGWLAWIDMPHVMLGADAWAVMQLTGQALNEHRRVQARAQSSALHAQRLEDVAYACGDWVWESDARHLYTWVLPDTPDAPPGSPLPRVGQPIPDAPTVDWLGQAPTSGLTLHDVLDQGEPLVRLVVQERHGDDLRYVSRSAVPMLDAQGGFRGYRGSMRDVTQSVEAKAQMWQRDEHLRAAALALPGAVVHASGRSWLSAQLDDHTGRLAEMLALPRSRAAHALRDVLQRLRAEDRRALQRACAAARDAGHVLLLRLQTRCDGPAARWIDVHATSQRDAAGLLSWSVFVADVTARVDAEQVLRAHEQRWQLAVSAAGLGLIHFDPDGDWVRLDTRSANLLGIADEACTVALSTVLAQFDPVGINALRGLLLERAEASGPVAIETTVPCHEATAPDGGEGVRHVELLLCASPRVDGEAASLMAICRDTSPLRRVEALQCAKDRAEASSRDKSALVSKVSHELKTPLNAIVGLAQLIQMKQGAAASAGVGEWLEQIARTGWHMSDVIDTLMDYGRVGSGRSGIRCEPVDLLQAVQEAILIVEPEACKRAITIDVDAPPAAVARCDQRAIRQVLVNLLSNAVKYNVEGGRIWIGVRCAGQVTVSVRDSGPGLTEGQLARAFQPFERLGAERSGIKGHGLGLLICKELVEEMGGSISVQSVSGQGCTFAVSLPAAMPAHDLPSRSTLRAA